MVLSGDAFFCNTIYLPFILARVLTNCETSNKFVNNWQKLWRPIFYKAFHIFKVSSIVIHILNRKNDFNSFCKIKLITYYSHFCWHHILCQMLESSRQIIWNVINLVISFYIISFSFHILTTKSQLLNMSPFWFYHFIYFKVNLVFYVNFNIGNTSCTLYSVLFHSFIDVPHKWAISDILAASLH